MNTPQRQQAPLPTTPQEQSDGAGAGESQTSGRGDGVTAADRVAGASAARRAGRGGNKGDGACPLLDHLDGLMEHLRSQLPKALRDFEVEAIHQARVATRRLGAAVAPLTVLLPERDLKPFRKTLKSLRRTLGPHRDTDVLLEHLRTLAKTAPAHSEAAERLIRTLAERRRRLQAETRENVGLHRMLGKLGIYGDLREELVRKLGDARQAELLAHRLADGVRDGLDEFSALSDLLSHQLAEGDGLTGLDPHELRICGKHLRYSLELAVADGLPLPRSVLQDFKAMQDALGAWHDDLVLAETALQEVQAGAMLHQDPAGAAMLLRLGADMADRSAGHLRGFAELWAAKGAALTETIVRSLTDARPGASRHGGRGGKVKPHKDKVAPPDGPAGSGGAGGGDDGAEDVSGRTAAKGGGEEVSSSLHSTGESRRR
ncbi:MAG: CHAD domain-containing protein [Tepidisphaerales bacterium]